MKPIRYQLQDNINNKRRQLPTKNIDPLTKSQTTIVVTTPDGNRGIMATFFYVANIHFGSINTILTTNRRILDDVILDLRLAI